MKRKLFLSALGVAVVTLTILNSCKKESIPDTDTTSAQDNMTAVDEVSKMLPTVNNIAVKEPGIKSLFDRGACYTTSIDSSNGYPRTLTIAYDPGGCVDSLDGKLRKGTIYAQIDRPYSQVGCKATIWTSGYSVDGKVFAFAGVTLERVNDSTITGTIGSIGNAGLNVGGAFAWYGIMKITQTAGYGDTDKGNDVFQMAAYSCGGTNKKGGKFVMGTSIPLIKRGSCKWIESGRIELQNEGKNDSQVCDFGNGTCDNKFKVTFAGQTFDLTM